MSCNHIKPHYRLTSVLAHRLMQQYIDCDARECPAKGAAFRWLCSNGEVQPDDRSQAYAR
ncbi:hypothetical protein AB0H71_13560 [Nocardia sp. NPDC050697]|uniref:hypothetical protein n=1 Tax=Nocardia sp. NPDC050697 TaxID=3155158 RepID=UPI0033DF02B9